MDIIDAIEREDLNQVKEILEKNPRDINLKNESGIWCGLLAANTGNLELVKFIVEYGMSRLETVDEDNNNMLHYAVRGGNLEVVKYLVEQVGMDILYGNKKLITPYELSYELAEFKGDNNFYKYNKTEHYLILEKENQALKEENIEKEPSKESDYSQKNNISSDYEKKLEALNLKNNDIKDYDKVLEKNILKYKNIRDYMIEKCGVGLSDMYKNPIRTGAFPDPSIVRVGEDYYMVNSSFIYFPCIPISHSKDLINWEIIGHAITNPAWSRLNNLEGGRGYWAPDISYNEGRFYITATYRLNDDGPVYRKQMVTSSDKPEGPYDEPVFIEEDGIDPSIFTDDDGRRYMLLNRGVRIFEISKDGRKKLSKPQLIWYGDCKIATEGPHLLHYNDYYYLFVAEGGTGMGHRISVGRSRNLMGPYESCPYNPIMRQTDKNATIQRTGHGKPIKTQNGEWYMVYLCARPIDGKYTILGRETALDKITWTTDGWPIVNDLKGPSVLQKKPDLFSKSEAILKDTVSNKNDEKLLQISNNDRITKESKIYIDSENQIENCSNKSINKKIRFGENSLSNDWSFSREPIEGQVKVKNGVLTIRGNKDDLHTTKCRSFVLTRQIATSLSIVCTVRWEKLSKGQNIGMTCYYDENSYIKYGIFGEEDGYYLRICEWVDDKYINIESEKLPNNDISKIELMIVVDELNRSFMYHTDELLWKRISHLKNVTYLSDEGLQKGKRFTGAMIGVYAHSGEAKEVSGEFLEFKIIK